MGCIYLALCKVNNKGYVGQAVDFKDRKKEHQVSAKLRPELAFHYAIRKYGWDSFEWFILYQDDDNDREWMDWLERRFIRKMKTKKPNGYNITDGGHSTNGWVPSKETRRKIGIACGKLNEVDVIEIRERYASGELARELGIEFGVTHDNILCIVNGTSWSWVGGPIGARRRGAIKGKKQPWRHPNNFKKSGHGYSGFFQ